MCINRKKCLKYNINIFFIYILDSKVYDKVSKKIPHNMVPVLYSAYQLKPIKILKMSFRAKLNLNVI